MVELHSEDDDALKRALVMVANLGCPKNAVDALHFQLRTTFNEPHAILTVKLWPLLHFETLCC